MALTSQSVCFGLQHQECNRFSGLTKKPVSSLSLYLIKPHITAVDTSVCFYSIYAEGLLDSLRLFYTLLSDLGWGGSGLYYFWPFKLGQNAAELCPKS